ncbi:MAG: hypothetical protein ABIP65_02280, partial [Vicinamibacterales bacterium]
MPNITTLLLIAAAAGATQDRPLATRSIPADQLCGARATFSEPAAAIKITGGAERMKKLFGPGEAVIINAGSLQGVNPGQRYVVRRVVADRFAQSTVGEQPRSIHTAGWVTVVESQAGMSVATVTEACDGISEGDYLEPLMELPSASSPIPAGEPDYARPAHLVLGDERRQMGGAGSLL